MPISRAGGVNCSTYFRHFLLCPYREQKLNLTPADGKMLVQPMCDRHLGLPPCAGYVGARLWARFAAPRRKDIGVKAAALIVAAGRGTRVGGGPKQYRLLGGKPVLRRTVEAFLRHPEIDTVRCVIHPDDASEYAAAVDGLVLLDPVSGGRSRQDSVRMGLESLEDIAPDIVLIHDAARPFVSAAVIDACLKGLDAAEGAIAAMQVHDTLKRGDKQGAIAATIDRTNLWRAQTPQAFRFNAILRAHR